MDKWGKSFGTFWVMSVITTLHLCQHFEGIILSYEQKYQNITIIYKSTNSYRMLKQISNHFTHQQTYFGALVYHHQGGTHLIT